jgi:predicted enzyme related to lactoylglutathione lyase
MSPTSVQLAAIRPAARSNTKAELDKPAFLPHHCLALKRQNCNQIGGSGERTRRMIIGLAGVVVNDQEAAMKFYTETLGFQLKRDIPMGNPDGDRWLTVISPEKPDGAELLLEPNGNPISSDYQRKLFENGISAAQFNSSDIQAEYERLSALGVEFTMPPTDIGPAIMAVFNDSCGNLITVVEEKVE